MQILEGFTSLPVILMAALCKAQRVKWLLHISSSALPAAATLMLLFLWPESEVAEGLGTAHKVW